MDIFVLPLPQLAEMTGGGGWKGAKLMLSFEGKNGS